MIVGLVCRGRDSGMGWVVSEEDEDRLEGEEWKAFERGEERRNLRVAVGG